MARIRQAGWCIGIPPLAVALVFLRDADVDSLNGLLTRSFLKSQFAFWADDVPSDVRPRVFLNLALLLAAVTVGLIAIVLGQGRAAVVAVSAAQAVVAFVGIIWDYAGDEVPDAIAHLVPAPGGRWTSFFYLGFALIALGLAVSATETKRVVAPPTPSPPTAF